VSIPGFRPKVIATDLDGTIVPHYTGVSERTVNAFNAAKEAGIEIYFVTGRPPRWMAEIREIFGYGNAICANGAMHYDLMNARIIEEWNIPVENIFEIAKRLRAAIKNVYFAIEFEGHFHREKNYIPLWDVGVDNVGVNMIEEMATQPAFKMLAKCEDEDFTSDQMLEIAYKEISDIATVTHSNSNPHEALLEISALGVSKGSTLAQLVARDGYGPDDVVTFGDNPNDFSMLSWATRSWAMEDGHPDAKKHAKFVAGPHKEDGVAIVIEQLLQLPVE
jgi:Cof subfamily protein (haloacid dehalogenase superfamily)